MREGYKNVRDQNLSKSFHENKVLDHINLKIEKGDVVGIIGPSGTGKSTLLRCINQLEIPEEGEVAFGGKRSIFPKTQRQPGIP